MLAVVKHLPDLSRAIMFAGINFAILNKTAPNAGSQNYSDDAIIIFSLPQFCLGQGKTFGVVGYRDF